MIAELVWSVIIGLAVSYLLYRALRVEEKPKFLPFDEKTRPWLLIVRSEKDKDDPFVLRVKRIAYESGVPVREVDHSSSPYPLPSHIIAVVMQARYLWFTKNTFDEELFRRSLSRAVVSFRKYLESWERSLSRSVVIIRPGLYATNPGSFPVSYTDSAFLLPGEFEITEDGAVETEFFGMPYHPYMEEGLRMFGSAVRDVRSLAPYREMIYVRSPITREERL